MEIKPQELRLTNLFEWKWNKEAVKIEWIRGEHVGLSDFQGSLFSQHIKEINGIELTPEWLERCKAINRTNITSEIIFGSYRSLEIVKDTDGYRLHLTTTTGGNISLRKIKYLHELQNSYHGVFGEELAIR